MERETAGPVWPSATPPQVAAAGRARALRWELHDVAELALVRAELRQHTAPPPDVRRDRSDIREQLILALDEMASNALRHGGGRRPRRRWTAIRARAAWACTSSPSWPRTMAGTSRAAPSTSGPCSPAARPC